MWIYRWMGEPPTGEGICAVKNNHGALLQDGVGNIFSHIDHQITTKTILAQMHRRIPRLRQTQPVPNQLGIVFPHL